MNIPEKVDMLYHKDSKETVTNFKELLQLSNESNVLYTYFPIFLQMTSNEQYLIRLKGFRLLCKQVRWDNENLINKNIDVILQAVHDEKPTAVRQKIQALTDIILYKKELNQKIKNFISTFDYSIFTDNMQDIIKRDIETILAEIEELSV